MPIDIENEMRYNKREIERGDVKMMIKKDYDFEELLYVTWSGAEETLEKVSEHEMEDELMDLLEESFFGSAPTLTQVNDFLRFEQEHIFRTLGIEN